MNVPVIAETPALAGFAQEVAARWGLPFGAAEESDFVLALTAARLELRQPAGPAAGAVWVDFVGGAVGHRRRFGGGRGQPIAKAVGLKGGRTPRVIDATAGLGRDAFVLASLGCSVTLIERSPVAAALLSDGLERAAKEPEVAPIVARMSLRHGNARQLLPQLASEFQAEVVYLDPMYPGHRGRAKAKKEMQAFQLLIGGDPDADELLTPALEAARERVVVKRPQAAEPLAGRAPTLAYPSRRHRFDVYVVRALAMV